MSLGNRVNLRKIDRMAGLTLRNCLRLHFDSILLFKQKSYPSAYFLSILALEELGKMEMLQDFVWHSRVDGRYDEDLELKYLERIYSHNIKQRIAVRYIDFSYKPIKRISKQILNGHLEILKQNSVYVGFTKKGKEVSLRGKLINPLKISLIKARKQITYLNDYLSEIILGTIKQTHILDCDSFYEIISMRLYNKLKNAWSSTSPMAKKMISQINKAR